MLLIVVILGVFFVVMILAFVGALFVFPELMGISKSKDDTDSRTDKN